LGYGQIYPLYRQSEAVELTITLDDMKKAKNILLSMKRQALLVKSKEELADVNFLIKVFADLSAGTIKV